MSEELKPCPFCGDEPQLECDSVGWKVYCHNPGCRVDATTLEHHTEKDFVIEAWNTRADTAQQAQIERLTAVYEAAKGLCNGEDWNNGIHAKKHGYREKLIAAVAAVRDGVVYHETPSVTDNGACVASVKDKQRDDLLREVRQLVDEQAEDNGLWFVAQYVSEAYLQAALRKLHSFIERACAMGIDVRDAKETG